jgi:cell division septum initiation protein DivIVA
MEKTNQLFVSVNEGVTLLISRFKQLKQENIELKTEINRLKNQLETKEKSFFELEESYRVLKVEKTLEGNQDTSSIRIQIDELVKEVDRCIDLLQK